MKLTKLSGKADGTLSVPVYWSSYHPSSPVTLYGLLPGTFNKNLSYKIGITPKVPYKVEVTVSDLNIRKGPGTNYAKTGKYTGKGVFTITEEKSGKGSDKGWGKLKSGAGWISLDFAKKI